MHVLVVEDNKAILTNILDYLELHNHTVDCAQDGLTGLHLAASQHFDIIVLDVMLPGIDGYQFCQKLREDAHIQTPIIMLTARDALDDKLRGLRMGADDYLLKPFDLSELIARMNSIVRRAGGGIKRNLQVGELILNMDTFNASRSGKPLKINPIGMKLLEHLMLKSLAFVKRSYLEEMLWGDNLPDSDSLRSHIHQLRQIVDKPFSFPLIENVRGIGYRIAQNHEV